MEKTVPDTVSVGMRKYPTNRELNSCRNSPKVVAHCFLKRSESNKRARGWRRRAVFWHVCDPTPLVAHIATKTVATYAPPADFAERNFFGAPPGSQSLRDHAGRKNQRSAPAGDFSASRPPLDCTKDDFALATARRSHVDGAEIRSRGNLHGVGGQTGRAGPGLPRANAHEGKLGPSRLGTPDVR